MARSKNYQPLAGTLNAPKPKSERANAAKCKTAGVLSAFWTTASTLGTERKYMANSSYSGMAPSGREKKEGAPSPKAKAEQDWQNIVALRQRIADLHARQKEAIHKLSTGRTSVEEVGVALAELEKELKEAQEQLKLLVDQQSGMRYGR